MLLSRCKYEFLIKFTAIFSIEIFSDWCYIMICSNMILIQNGTAIMNDKLFNGYGYIYEVYKTKSFSKAAENLFISQSSLSTTIRKIEKRIGVEIFDRSTTPIGLTEYGMEYIKSVQKIMDIENEFQSHVFQLEELVTGQLSVGGSSNSLSHTLPSVISSFTRLYPGVSLRLIEGGSYQLEKQLSDGILDLAVDNRIFPPEHFSRLPLFKEQLLLAVPRSCPVNEHLKAYQLTAVDILNQKHKEESFPIVPLDHFSKEPFLFLRTGNDTRHRADKLCSHYNFTPRIILKLDQQITAYNLARYGVGLAFISDWVILHMKPDDSLIYYRLDPEFTIRDVSIFYKSSRYLTRSMQEFLRLAGETRY